MSSLVDVLDVQLSVQSRGAKIHILRNVNFSVSVGERIAILGRSGVGKSTLLRSMAGIIPPDSGTIRWNVPRVVGDCVFLPQTPAVLDEITIEEQIRLPRRLLGQAMFQKDQRSTEFLNGFGLSELDARKVARASAGQKQAIALVGMLSLNPTLILLDEPFASIDALSRQDAMIVLRDWLRGTRGSALLVTHSIWEAIGFADRILVFSGTPLGAYTEYTVSELGSSAENALLHDKIYTSLGSVHAG